ncbi:MAG TPA: hypothetical protein PLO61_04145 [Fimbriimonadaceae bacterium]|nr:hypothetical protein [Fimbriimonadaceae bacterium]HRJ32847.1 hypothetical protein [Fimbriimonadaceae bacterium]
MRWLISGFGPFLDVLDNPSARLARSVSDEPAILDVSFAAAEEQVEQARRDGVTHWLMLGVKSQAQNLCVELYGRNLIGKSPDVRGEVRGPGPIHPAGPSILASSLFARDEVLRPQRSWNLSSSAGSYLCNFLLYTCLERAPEIQAGFVHVPLESTLPLATQQRRLKRLLRLLQSPEPIR